MSELKRKVTTLSGGSVKPLRLEEHAATRPPDRVELREPRSSGKTLHKRILPVNENRLSFDLRPPEGKPIKKPKLGCDEPDPSTEYYEFMAFDQAGAATIGSSNTRENSLVAIKRRAAPVNIPKDVRKRLVHENVVSLFDLFYEGDQICMIYEQMDVSLRHLTGTCEGQWDDYKIGAICKEVGSILRMPFIFAYLFPIIHGLLYIHNQCSLYHGALACDTVLLSRDGYIKIANIGDSIIEQRVCTVEKIREDTRCLGYIMVELMEPTTYALNPRTIVLEYPVRWKANTGLKDFLAATASKPLEELAQDIFLPRESIRNCLRPDVFRTLISANIDWELLPAVRTTTDATY